MGNGFYLFGYVPIMDMIWWFSSIPIFYQNLLELIKFLNVPSHFYQEVKSLIVKQIHPLLLFSHPSDLPLLLAQSTMSKSHWIYKSKRSIFFIFISLNQFCLESHLLIHSSILYKLKFTLIIWSFIHFPLWNKLASNKPKNGLKNSKIRIFKLIKTWQSSSENTKKQRTNTIASLKLIIPFSITANLLMNSTFSWKKETRWSLINLSRRKSRISWPSWKKPDLTCLPKSLASSKKCQTSLIPIQKKWIQSLKSLLRILSRTTSNSSKSQKKLWNCLESNWLTASILNIWKSTELQILWLMSLMKKFQSKRIKGQSKRNHPKLFSKKKVFLNKSLKKQFLFPQ